MTELSKGYLKYLRDYVRRIYDYNTNRYVYNSFNNEGNFLVLKVFENQNNSFLLVSDGEEMDVFYSDTVKLGIFCGEYVKLKVSYEKRFDIIPFNTLENRVFQFNSFSVLADESNKKKSSIDIDKIVAVNKKTVDDYHSFHTDFSKKFYEEGEGDNLKFSGFKNMTLHIPIFGNVNDTVLETEFALIKKTNPENIKNRIEYILDHVFENIKKDALSTIQYNDIEIKVPNYFLPDCTSDKHEIENDRTSEIVNISPREVSITLLTLLFGHEPPIKDLLRSAVVLVEIFTHFEEMEEYILLLSKIIIEKCEKTKEFVRLFSKLFLAFEVDFLLDAKNASQQIDDDLESTDEEDEESQDTPLPDNSQGKFSNSLLLSLANKLKEKFEEIKNDEKLKKVLMNVNAYEKIENHQVVELPSKAADPFSLFKKLMQKRSKTMENTSNLKISSKFGGESISSHMEVLVSRSHFFHTMLSFGGLETNAALKEGKVVIEDLREESIEFLVNFLCEDISTGPKLTLPQLLDLLSHGEMYFNYELVIFCLFEINSRLVATRRENGGNCKNGNDAVFLKILEVSGRLVVDEVLVSMIVRSWALICGGQYSERAILGAVKFSKRLEGTIKDLKRENEVLKLDVEKRKRENEELKMEVEKGKREEAEVVEDEDEEEEEEEEKKPKRKKRKTD